MEDVRNSQCLTISVCARPTISFSQLHTSNAAIFCHPAWPKRRMAVPYWQPWPLGPRITLFLRGSMLYTSVYCVLVYRKYMKISENGVMFIYFHGESSRKTCDNSCLGVARLEASWCPSLRHMRCRVQLPCTWRWPMGSLNYNSRSFWSFGSNRRWHFVGIKCWSNFSQSQVRNFWRSFFEARSIEDVTPTLTVPFLCTGSEGDVCGLKRMVAQFFKVWVDFHKVHGLNN